MTKPFDAYQASPSVEGVAREVTSNPNWQLPPDEQSEPEKSNADATVTKEMVCDVLGRWILELPKPCAGTRSLKAENVDALREQIAALYSQTAPEPTPETAANEDEQGIKACLMAIEESANDIKAKLLRIACYRDRVSTAPLPTPETAEEVEPDLPENECSTADMLRKVAGHLRSGAMKCRSDLDVSEWVSALYDRARILDNRVSPSEVEKLRAELADEKYLYAGKRIQRKTIEARNNEILELRTQLSAANAEIERLQSQRAEAQRERDEAGQLVEDLGDIIRHAWRDQMTTEQKALFDAYASLAPPAAEAEKPARPPMLLAKSAEGEWDWYWRYDFAGWEWANFTDTVHSAGTDIDREASDAEAVRLYESDLAAGGEP